MLALVVVALGYGSATSGGFSEGQTALGLGLIIATVFSLRGHVLTRPVLLITLALSICLCLGCASFKMQQPYQWWGLREPAVHEATESLSIPALHGIAVSPATKAAIEGVTAAIDSASQPGDDVFVFPHIPIFYLLSDRYPSTFTLVQWFDFASRRAVEDDLRRIERRPPRVIVIAEIPETVYDAHEDMFANGAVSAQREMRDGLMRLIRTAAYRQAGAWPVYDGYRIVVYVAR